MSSFNSLSNIAQRYVDEASSDDRPRTSASATSGSTGSTTAPLSAAAGAASAGAATASATSGITTELFRNELARAFQSLQQPTAASAVENMEVEPSADAAAVAEAALDEPEDADDGVAGDDSDVLPRCYRRHRFTEQLRTMAAMGFINHTQNVNYLTLADGNVEHAINLLMLGMN